MKIYSDLYCDQVIINAQHYYEFRDEYSKAKYFEEERVNDLIYYAYEVFEELEFNITKRRLLLIVAAIADEVPVEEIMQLKHFELKRLLYASKDNYSTIYDNIISNISEDFQPIDPED